MKSTLDVVRYFASRTPRTCAIRTARAETDYRQLLDSASAIAHSLVREGTRVAGLAADNGTHWIEADLAAQLANVTLVPLPPFFSSEQTLHALRDSGADAVLADSVFARQIAAACGDGAAVPIALRESLALYRLPNNAGEHRTSRSTAKISYTSGTTGRPKGVCLTQHAMDAVAHSLWTATTSLEITRHLCLLPLATLLENIAGVYAPLRSGATVIAPSLAEIGISGSTGLDVRRFVECIAHYAPHSVILLPQTLAALVAALETGAPRPTELRFAAVGGARVPLALLERAERVGLPVYEGYGLTECASVVALNTPGAARRGSVGRALPHARIRIDEKSEIRISGVSICGYTGADATPEEIATGDLGRMDADGFLHVTGRCKNVFITSFGRNVSPDWVEAELTRAAPIAQAAVFGEARPWNVAVLVPSTPGVTAKELQVAVDAVNADLPDYARIRDWIRADEPFATANGLATGNGRNRRPAIWGRYCARIAACYYDTIAV